MSAIKSDLHLASISGGTDICGCFVAGNPLVAGLARRDSGRRCSAWPSMSSTRTGKPLRDEKGELVCTKPFPSMPVMFWNDPDGEKYHNAYFARFDNIWCHGDFAEWTRAWRHDHPWPLRCHAQSRRRAHRHGRNLCAGRAHAGGVEALAIGQDWDHDVRVVLFVRLRDGVGARRGARQRASSSRSATAPRRAMCRRRSSRSPTFRAPNRARSPNSRCATSSMAARSKNKEALANPEALDLYQDLPELQADPRAPRG